MKAVIAHAEEALPNPVEDDETDVDEDNNLNDDVFDDDSNNSVKSTVVDDCCEWSDDSLSISKGSGKVIHHLEKWYINNELAEYMLKACL